MKKRYSNPSYPRAERALIQANLQNIKIKLNLDEAQNKCASFDIYDKNDILIEENYSTKTLFQEKEFFTLFKIKDLEYQYYNNLVNILNRNISYNVQIDAFEDTIIECFGSAFKNISLYLTTKNIKRDIEIFTKSYGIYGNLVYQQKDIVKQYENITSSRVGQIENQVFNAFYLNFLEKFEYTACQINQILLTKDYIKLNKLKSLCEYKTLWEKIKEKLGDKIIFYIDFEKGFIVKNGIDIDAFQINNNLTIEDIEENFKNIETTEKETIVKSRIGQDKLRKELLKHKQCCELCGLELEDVLVASHIKPWSESTNDEKLDLENVLLLCPMHDKLFDKGYISFDNNGKIIISNELSEETQALLNIHDESYIGLVSEKKSEFLKYHRQNIFKK